ncbi:hypothetical protein CRENBAI_019164 [Crenichthys baileyi]|uniref:Uncharacterized protein n=1 Tax=Crenichthys baileyi TaxID=28760 RepID=A0AAV9RF24_9TELE
MKWVVVRIVRLIEAAMVGCGGGGKDGRGGGNKGRPATFFRVPAHMVPGKDSSGKDKRAQAGIDTCRKKEEAISEALVTGRRPSVRRPRARHKDHSPSAISVTLKRNEERGLISVREDARAASNTLRGHGIGAHMEQGGTATDPHVLKAKCSALKNDVHPVVGASSRWREGTDTVHSVHINIGDIVCERRHIRLAREDNLEDSTPLHVRRRIALANLKRDKVHADCGVRD